jgi:hypothetical protein
MTIEIDMESLAGQIDTELLQTEKEQIIGAFDEGANCVFSGNDEPSSEQYYNDTYKK